MKITLTPSALASPGRESFHFLTSYVLNDRIAIDAGSIGFLADLQQQARIEHVFLSHTHIDHLASLPILLENTYDSGREPLTIHGSQAVLDSLQKDLFNDRIWPDFIALSRPGRPLLHLHTLVPGASVHLDGLDITPVSVNHTVPTVGFILAEETAAVVLAGDTGPTEEIWERANALAQLRAVFLEATFPEEMSTLAQTSKHLTPAGLAREVKKIKKPVKVFAVHLKARYHSRIARELEALAIPNLELVNVGQAYLFQ